VGWMFERRGVIEVKPGPTEDQVLEVALEAGALDVLPIDKGFEVRTEPNDLHRVVVALERPKWPLGEIKITYIPKDPMRLEIAAAQKVLRLVDLLEENDDVQNVHGNFEIEDAVMEQIASAP
jgi:transcriptional/translational regulatory protein YebC/TACO1